MTIRTKKLFTVFFSFLFISTLSAKSAFARSGCCSHHGGVCGCGCCDGTGLSATCAPYYPNCNGSNDNVVIIRPTSTPRPTKLPTTKPTKRPTIIPTARPTKKPTPTKKPSPTATMTPTNTPTPTLTQTPTLTVTVTLTPTEAEITPTVQPTTTITPKTNNPTQPKTTFWQKFLKLFNRK